MGDTKCVNDAERVGGTIMDDVVCVDDVGHAGVVDNEVEARGRLGSRGRCGERGWQVWGDRSGGGSANLLRDTDVARTHTHTHTSVLYKKLATANKCTIFEIIFGNDEVRATGYAVIQGPE